MLRSLLLKNTLLLSAFFLLQNLVILFVYDPANLQSDVLIRQLTSGLSVLLTLYCCFASHRYYYRKNGNFLSYKAAYLLGFLILFLSHVLHYIFALAFYGLFFKQAVPPQNGISALIDLFSHGRPQFSATQLNDFRFNAAWFDLKNILSSFGFIGLLLLIYFESLYMIFLKAGKNPLNSVIPFYNRVVLIQLTDKPGWWFFMLFIPFVNVYYYVRITHGLSSAFGKDSSFTAGLLFLPFVYYPKLGLSELTYISKS